MSFGELRSILQRSPTEAGWKDLCRWCDEQPPEALREHTLPYALSHLGRWPKPLRAAPRRWVERCVDGEALPQLALVTRVTYSGVANIPQDDEDFGEVFEAAMSRDPRAQIAMMILSRHLDASDLLALCGEEALGHLVVLELRGHQFGDEGAAVFRRAVHLSALEHLDLSGNLIHDHGAELLSLAPFMPRLEVLRLGHNAIGDAGCAALATRSGFEGLRELDLSENAIRDYGLRMILDMPWVEGLERLNLSRNLIGPDGIRALTRDDGVRGLKHLDLRSCPIEDLGVRALAESPYLSNLETLRISFHGISPEVVDAFFASPYLSEEALASSTD